MPEKTGSERGFICLALGHRKTVMAFPHPGSRKSDRQNCLYRARLLHALAPQAQPQVINSPESIFVQLIRNVGPFPEPGSQLRSWASVFMSRKGQGCCLVPSSMKRVPLPSSEKQALPALDST